MVLIPHRDRIAEITGIGHDIPAQVRHDLSGSAETTVFTLRHGNMDFPHPRLCMCWDSKGRMPAFCLQYPKTDGNAGGGTLAEGAQMSQEFGATS